MACERGRWVPGVVVVLLAAACGSADTAAGDSDSDSTSTSAGVVDLPDMGSGWEPMDCEESPIEGWKQVAAGNAVTCGITLADEIRCWGAFTDGYPCGPFQAIDVEQGACAVDRDGVLYCWAGHPDFRGPYPGPYDQVVIGGGNCALRSDTGHPECFDGFFENLWGQPPDVPLKDVAVGSDFACGLKMDDTLECWGAEMELPPKSFAFQDLAADSEEICGVRPDGEIECWGTLALDNPPPGPFTAVSLGGGSVCGLKVDGSMACFGADVSGVVSGVPDGEFVAVDLGAAHACALRPDATVECWGTSWNGETTPPTQ